MTVLILVCSFQVPADEATVTYLANAGVMVNHGETSILFDPLFNNNYGQYELLPNKMRAALITGQVPFDKVDAVFISHFHGDHFAPEDMLQLLIKRQDIYLYAPEQAVAAMREVANGLTGSPVSNRVTSIDISYGAEPVRYELVNIEIAASRIPHSGWPEKMGDIENLAFRVTLEGSSTVLHLGDADTKDYHYSQHAGFWADLRGTGRPCWLSALNRHRRLAFMCPPPCPMSQVSDLLSTRDLTCLQCRAKCDRSLILMIDQNDCRHRGRITCLENAIAYKRMQWLSRNKTIHTGGIHV
jgi:L-ascorbate metabolism protein UlaG (beta-lactamase superfamily)